MFNEVNNISLFEKGKIILVDQSSDKITKTIEEISQYLDGQKIFLFAEILDKKSKLRNYFEKSKNLQLYLAMKIMNKHLKKLY